MNFRDVGGLSTRRGDVVQRGRLFRSDVLTRLTEDDRRLLIEHGVTTVVDLRTDEELERYGTVVWESGGPRHHRAPLVADLAAHDDTDWGRLGVVAGVYHQWVERGQDVVAETLDVLAEGLPAIVHCMSGRDRTAVIVALVLGMLDIDDEVIAADYARSEPAMVRLLAWLRANDPETVRTLVTQPDAFVQVPASTMREFLGEFRRRYGSFDRFADELGRTAQVEEIRNQLLAREHGSR